MRRRQIQRLEGEPEIRALIALDPDFALVVERYGPPPSRRRPGGFATLLRIILGQQVSTAAAAAIWQRLEDGVDDVTPDCILAVDADGLRQFGLSRPKVRYAIALAKALLDGELDLDGLQAMDDEAAIAALTRITGIGPWTAEIYLLAALGRLDVWPAADLALMIAAQELKVLPARPSAQAMRQLAEAWRPYRAVAARLLWHYYGGERGRFAAPLGEN